MKPLLLTSLLLFSSQLMGSVGLKMDGVHHRADGDAFSKKDFLAICKNIATALSVKKAMWGYGVVGRYRCIHGKKRLKGPAKFSAKWRLLVTNEDDLTSFSLESIERKGKKRYFIPLARVDLSYSDTLKEALKKPNISVLLATRLLDEAPYAFLVDPTQKKHTIKRQFRATPPSRFAVFSHRFLENRAAESRLIATLARAGRKGPSYRLHLQDPYYDGRKRYFAQNKEGRGKKSWLLESRLNRFLRKYDSRVVIKNLLDILSGGFAGVRYGTPLTKGDTIVAKSPMLGIFTEVRGGPLAGLRWYWDIGPEVEEVVNGLKTSITWSRPSFGWAATFRLMESDALSFELDLTPKVGLMDLDGRFIVTSNQTEKDTIASFITKNAFTVGIDGGITWKSPWFLIRTWGASDLQALSSYGNSNSSVSSIRAGLDTFWDLFTMWEMFEFTLLGFVAGERLSIERDLQDALDNQTDGVGIQGLSFITLYAGLGVTLQW